ncbi:hypothetical protein Halhy_4608 [Haliscomenobacter hydrossis DSM 1100]|uniref:Uncharacterized protein n=2 Tax=Haliscomenobacter TaxID=2349 RepID=F4KUK9_HALH1|nr:hypothetical protein Halhy_4608 [Haliscomenobacter hydrossis DSM 1100]
MPLEGDWVMDVNKKETAASTEPEDAVVSLCWNCRTPLATEGEQAHCSSCGIALKAQIPDGNLKIVPIDRPNNEDSRKIQGN